MKEELTKIIEDKMQAISDYKGKNKKPVGRVAQMNFAYKNGHIIRLLKQRTEAISKNKGLEEIENELKITCFKSQKELLNPFKVYITFEKE